MIISLSKKFVFVHIHKCAGESVEIACAPSLTRNDFLIGAGSTDKRSWISDAILERVIGLSKHASAEEIAKRMGPKNYETFFSFAVVRRPEDRIYSLYKYCIEQVRRNIAFQAYLGRADLAEISWEETVQQFWAKAGTTLAASTEMVKTSHFPADCGFMHQAPFTWQAVKAALVSTDFEGFLQSEFLLADNGFRSQLSMISNNQTGKLIVNQIIKLEELDQSWPDLARKIGVTAQLPQQNRSHSKGIAKMTDEAKALLHARFAGDYAAFAY